MVATLSCGTCGEAAASGAKFCEACGSPLAIDGQAGGSAAVGPAALADPPAAKGPAVCVSCAAGSIDADGYCTQCGFKQPDPGDHVEEDHTTFAAVTDLGRHHHRNEDAFAIGEVKGEAGTTYVLVVCDGVSSTADSHIAARTATAAARDVLIAAVQAAANPTVALTEAAASAQRAAAAVPPKAAEVPSCTFVAAIARVPANNADEVVLWTACLGDSRAYLVGADSVVRQLTVDDSLAAEPLARGEAIEVVYARPESHTITRWLGADAVDVTPALTQATARQGDLLLLCSDGLWNYALTPAAMRNAIEAGVIFRGWRCRGWRCERRWGRCCGTRFAAGSGTIPDQIRK